MEDTIDEITALYDKLDQTEEEKILQDKFLRLKDEILSHQFREEKDLFPLLRSYSENRTADLRRKCIDFMEKTEYEHDEAGILLNELHEMTSGFSAPENAPKELKEIYSKLDALEKDTLLHIHMENSILFKMI